jgi:hypothetical protein
VYSSTIAQRMALLRFQDYLDDPDAVEARCGHCRGSEPGRPADILGLLSALGGEVGWMAFKRGSRNEVDFGGALFEDWVSIKGGIRTHCRHGHEIRISYRRLGDTIVANQGVIYLT